jgi:hypothetical protein
MRARKAVIPAPYWRQPGHLGCVRVDRFIRWLAGSGFHVVVVRAGSTDRTEGTPWGTEVTVTDPIGFYRDVPEGEHPAIPLRRTNPLRRSLAYTLLVPDPLAAWARRAARHRSVLAAAQGADWVLASSPPESVHLVATALASRLDARSVVDLRDGWLDEPMIPLLSGSSIQRLRHRLLERRVLRRADRIFVTSDHWRLLLTDRLPLTGGRTTVLTNAYPETGVEVGRAAATGDRLDDQLTLLYTGKLYSSRAERRTRHLLDPLAAGLRESPVRGRLLFVGNLTDDERRDLDRWRGRLVELGWQLEVRPPVARDQALEMIDSADGLLLLSSSVASIPSKLFDYLPSGRPILAVAPIDSAVWEVCERVSQVLLVETGGRDAGDVVGDFLERCRQPATEFDLPAEFTEDHVREVFLGALAPQWE